MVRTRLWVFVVLTFAAFCAGTCHAQKTTVDPNIKQKARPAGKHDADPRLALKVTYQAWHAPVRTILGDLTAATGVKLRAGYNTKDWQVRDRRMNISVKDVPLAKLMDSIARVMKFKWSRSDDVTPPVYRLIVDRKLIGDMQAQASQLDKEFKDEEVKRRTGLIEALAKVADISGAELQALRQENPYLYMCAQSGFAKTVTQMMANEPALRDAFVNANRAANVDMRSFNAATQQTCFENVRGNWPLDHITQNRQPLSDGFTDAVLAGQVCFDCIRRPFNYVQSKRLFYYGSVCVNSPEESHFLGDMRDPYAEATRAWANACLDSVDNNEQPGEGWSTVASKYFPTEEKEAKREMEPYQMFDPLVEHPDDPDLHKEVTLKVSDDDKKAAMDEIIANGGRNFPRVEYQVILKALADASDMGIVSDSFSVVLGNTSNIPEKAEIAALLDKLGDGYRLNWEKHGSIIEIRRRDWFRRRASQLPDEWLDPWRKELKKNGAPSLDTYAHIAALADDQVEENINSDFLLDQVVGGMGGDSRNRPFCRLYTQLSDAQHQLILSVDGLDTRLLSLGQSQYYANMFLYGWQDSLHTEDFTAPPQGASVTISGASKPGPDGSTSYAFTVRLASPGSDSREQKWNISLRKVIPAKSPADKQQ